MKMVFLLDLSIPELKKGKEKNRWNIANQSLSGIKMDYIADKKCVDTRGQWNLSCQQGLCWRVGQRCNFNQHLKFIRFPNVNSNTHREFELWVSMIFCTYITPPKSSIIFECFLCFILAFSSELNMCYRGIKSISSI